MYSFKTLEARHTDSVSLGHHQGMGRPAVPPETLEENLLLTPADSSSFPPSLADCHHHPNFHLSSHGFFCVFVHLSYIFLHLCLSLIRTLIYENENTSLKRYMHLSVPNSIIYNSQDMKAA